MKKAKASRVNLAAVARELLQQTPEATNEQIAEAITAEYGVSVNRASLNTAVCNARRRLGIRKRRWTVPQSAAEMVQVLEAARELLLRAGSAEAAVEAIQQVQKLQLVQRKASPAANEDSDS